MMEKRVFKEALPPAYKLAYVVIAALCVVGAWHKLVALAVPAAVVLLLITDKLTKGEYTLESQVLIMRRGRFFRDKILLVASIGSVRKRTGSARMLGNVEVECLGARYILNPETPDSFTECLAKRMDEARAANRDTGGKAGQQP